MPEQQQQQQEEGFGFVILDVTTCVRKAFVAKKSGSISPPPFGQRLDYIYSNAIRRYRKWGPRKADVLLISGRKA